MKSLMQILADISIPATDVGISNQSADNVVLGLVNLVYYVAGIVAVLVIIIAGFMMAVQGNNPEKIKMRKNAITMALIGLVIVMVAFTITQWIAGVF